MPTLDQWKSFYDSWTGSSPLLASTGHEIDEHEFVELGTALADQVNLGAADRVLDVGCASGTLTSYWASRAQDITGVDYCESLLKEGAERHPHIDFVHAEAAALPYEDASFDVIMCFGVLLSLPDHDYAERAVREMFRVAKPGARIMLGSVPDSDRREAMRKRLASTGPWYRRTVPQPIRRAARRILTPVLRRGARAPQPAMLWFDIEALATTCRAAGFDVEVYEDHPFAGYEFYRKTLILQRRDPNRRG